MSRDYLSKSPTELRRKDRGITDESWIKEFLHHAPFAALATQHEGQPFVNSNLFYYDEEAHAVFLHTAREGRTRSNSEAHPRACLSVSEMGRMLPADVALEFSVEYKGVAIFGPISVVEDEQEATRILQKMLDKYFPHLKPTEDYRPPVPEELKRTTVFRLDIEVWSGKQKQVEADFPGAFMYPVEK